MGNIFSNAAASGGTKNVGPGSGFQDKDGDPSNLEPPIANDSALPHTGLTTSTAAFQGAHDTTIYNGNFIIANGNVTQINNAYESYMCSKSTLDWLPRNKFRAIQSDTLKKRTPGTITWFIECEGFRAWLTSSGGILWVTGMPGAGKTVLISVVIGFLEDLAKTSPDISVAFAYCRYSEPMSVEDILIALIRQHLERHPHLTNIVALTFARHNLEDTTPSQAELLDLLKEISKQFKITFYSLDALDESPVDWRFDLVEAISSINAHFFITSRPLDILKKSFPDATFMELEAHDDDMKLFIEQKIAGNPVFRELLKKHECKEEVISKVVEKSRGMFLHASLQIEELRHCYSLSDLHRTLTDFPVGIKDMYMETMKRVSNQIWKHAQLAKLAILWILHTRRTLSFKELQVALAYDPETKTFDVNDTPSEEFLVTLCCGLVTVDRETQLVRLVHYTAKGVLQPLLAVDYPHPQSVIADACISRLISCNFHDTSLRDVGGLTRAFRDNPLLPYASDHWAIHVQKSVALPHVLNRAKRFFQSCKGFPFMHNFKPPGDGHKIDRLGPLHVAARYNFADVIRHLAAESPSGMAWDVNEPTTANGFTPLMLASYSGHLLPLQALLKVPGIKVNQGKKDGWTALIIAAYGNHDGIVQCLLNVPGICVNVCASDGWTALMLASHRGHQRVIRRLLRVPNINVNARRMTDSGGRTALMLAVSRGHEGAVEALPKAPTIQVNATSGRPLFPMKQMQDSLGGTTETHPAATSIPMPNDLSIRKTYGWSALMFASARGFEGIARRLLRVPGIDVNISDFGGSTALSLAAYEGQDQMVELLLDVPGIQVNLPREDGHTPLTIASQKGHNSIIKRLLNAPGIDVNARQEDGWTGLMLASSEGHDCVVRNLLKAPAIDVNLATDRGVTALIAASSNGHQAIVLHLLAVPGIEPNTDLEKVGVQGV